MDIQIEQWRDKAFTAHGYLDRTAKRQCFCCSWIFLQNSRDTQLLPMDIQNEKSGGAQHLLYMDFYMDKAMVWPRFCCTWISRKRHDGARLFKYMVIQIEQRWRDTSFVRHGYLGEAVEEHNFCCSWISSLIKPWSRIAFAVQRYLEKVQVWRGKAFATSTIHYQTKILCTCTALWPNFTQLILV